MPDFNLNYLTLLTAIANIALGVIVVRSKDEKPLRGWFFIFTVLVSIWSLTIFFFQSYDSSLFLLKSQYSTGALVLVSAIPWVTIMARGSVSRVTLAWLGFLAMALASIPYIGDILVSGIRTTSNGILIFDQGPFYTYYGAFIFVLMGVIIYILSNGHKKAAGEKRHQLRYVLLGIIFFALASIIVNIVLPALGFNSIVAFDAQSSLIWVALTTYSITRYGLFNIKVIATQIFVALILILVTTRILSATTRGDIIFESLILVSTAIVGYFLINSVRGEIKRREEIERLAKEKTETLVELERRNKNLATLQHISDIVLNEIDTKAMTQKILDELPKQLEGCVGGLLSIAKEDKLTAYAITENNIAKKVISLIGGHLEKYSFPIKKEYNRIHEALVDKKSIDSDNLADFISPPIPKAVAVSIQKITGARHVEVFPLYAAGEPLGVMLFVFNRPGSEIHDKNYAIAKAISDDLSLAIQRAQAFEQLKAANEYLAQLDKMKDEFISMASHELNTPLAAIEGYLSMILDEGMGKIDKQSRTYLNRAYASSKRLAELILDLLNVSRIEQGRLKMKFAHASIGEMIESVTHELEIKADAKKIYLKVEADKKLPKIWCDPDRIREVIVNLTGNAIKFTDKGGITIKASQPDAKTLRVQVIDTGRGIAKDDQKKLFQKFSQVKREIDEHQGTGLGLYISKNFVELHNGKLWVDSEEGKGATFSFDLPLIKEPPMEVDGAMLEQPINAPQIEKDKPGQAPQVVTDSVKSGM